MGIRNLGKILRFFSIPHTFSSSSSSSFLFSNSPSSTTYLSSRYYSSSSFLFPTGYSSLSSPEHSFSISSTIDVGHSRFKLGLQLNTPRYVCSYSGSTFATSKQVSEIVSLISEDVSDLGFRLNSMNVCLSMGSIFHIFQKLENERASALGFFDWFKNSHPELRYDPKIGSLVVNNCGLLGNFEALVPILTEFNLKGMQLGRKAFEFLQVLCLDKDSTMECVGKIVDVLNEVGGTCQSSGIQLLIEMFSCSDSLEIAEFVKRSARLKVSHYNVMMRTMCKRGDYEKAGDLLKEMKRNGCDLKDSTYNLLLSCLCKNGKFAEACQLLETIEKEYGVPDASTFDVLINFLCGHCQFDLVLKILDKMASKGIEPSISTHAAVIKSYFESGKYDEAHGYVVYSAGNMSYSSSANYSLLATLHLKKGNALRAQEILREMMDKGLKPNFAVYMKIRKRLEKKNKEDLSLELFRRYSSLIET